MVPVHPLLRWRRQYARGYFTAPAAANVASVVVDAGPAGTSDVNTLFTTVTVCVPGSTTSCQTIDHIQVDTASYRAAHTGPGADLELAGANR